MSSSKFELLSMDWPEPMAKSLRLRHVVSDGPLRGPKGGFGSDKLGMDGVLGIGIIVGWHKDPKESVLVVLARFVATLSGTIRSKYLLIPIRERLMRLYTGNVVSIQMLCNRCVVASNRAPSASYPRA